MSTQQKSVAARCLLLGAVGDALGAPIEFHNAENIARTYGTKPPEDLAFCTVAPARFTDDTQMTLFMAEGLRRALDRGVAGDRDAFRRVMADSLIDWLATQDRRVFEALEARDSSLLKIDDLRVQRAPGNTCMTSCYHIQRGGELPDMDHRINDQVCSVSRGSIFF